MYSIHLKKQRFIILTALSFVCLFFSCSTKEVVLTPEQQLIQYLTGTGNRYWRIRELYQNDVKQTLTAAQLSYTKTYTIGVGANAKENIGTWNDANGFAGTWEVKDVKRMEETVQNAPAGIITLNLTINKIGAFDMDVQYTSNGQTIRTVYFAY